MKSSLATLEFDNSFVRELPGYYVRCRAEIAPQAQLIAVNIPLGQELGLHQDSMTSPEATAIFSGNQVPPSADPIAQAYAGHQFGGFSPRLGDGRALLLGEVIDIHGQRRDIALKGSGRTPFSRNGDGKCALGPALREYLISEAMATLGIASTRTLAVVTTGETIRRDRALPGAVLTRVAASHLRIGTFEYFAQHAGAEAVKKLADYAIARHDPALLGSDQPYLGLLQAVANRQAELIARWLGVGFIHGVMNTDNMTISGETIDFGPCAFLDAYHPDTVFSSIDHHGRYAYGQQAAIAQWNLARFAETLLPLLDPDSKRAIELATRVLEDFPLRHEACWSDILREKLGFDHQGDPAVDRKIAEDFLSLLQQRRLDFTNSFRALFSAAEGCSDALDHLSAADGDFREWRQVWEERQPNRSPALLARMKHANPWLIPRNHQVENALEAAVDRNNLAPFERLLAAIQSPFDERDAERDLTAPASAAFNASFQTFCGT